LVITYHLVLKFVDLVLANKLSTACGWFLDV